MDSKNIPMQIELEEEIHSAFKSRCAVEKVTMKAKAVELIEKWTKEGK